MKNPNNLSQLPDPPLAVQDLPETLPPIKQSELVAYANAESTFRLARAHFEAKRGALMTKLLQLYKSEYGSYSARLDDDGRLIFVDRSSHDHVTSKSDRY